MKDEVKRSHERILHIAEGIKTIQQFTKGRTEKEYLADKMLMSAVLFEFSVIGKAINHVDETILAKYDYPWRRIRSFRNLIAHEYFNILPEAVWQIIEKDLLDLDKIITQMLKDFKR
ncbi:MAG: DUF86 domain-containing protein [Bacteroidetes bacterium]|nr:DUF86 domain-containing protein [Bacteroidota bacterium]MBU1720129.1 DUF86 domain-containing protein [Bacteroidota bacterium]